MRTALALQRLDPSGQAPRRDPTAETAPRGFLFEDIFDVVWDQRLVAASPSRVPSWLRLAREIYRRQDEFDVIVTWSERLTLAYLALQRMYGAGKPHIPVITQFSKPNIEWPMRLLGRQMHAAITISSAQRDYAVSHGLVAADKLYLVRYLVDTLFYRPRPAVEDVISAVGAEMRDYTTLFAALEGTDLKCHVAAGTVRVPGPLRLIKDRRVPVESFQRQPNPNVTVQKKTLPELRELYARSRFVVVPLLESQSDNGVTVILEAMAMGKAVICTRTRGQVDVLEDGVTGLFVPVGDAAALRAAMVSLWNDPERARAMGARGRAFVERHHSAEQFCANVAKVVGAAIAGRPATESEWWEVADFPSPPLPIAIG